MSDPDWDTWIDWLDAIETRGVNLTVWEEEFVESIGLQLGAKRRLTANQAKTLERIYAARTP